MCKALEELAPITLYMVGHTAAGKTTLGKALCKNLPIQFVSQSKHKRSLVQDYSTANSLDEGLRERGYRLAIEEAKTLFRSGKSVLIDASFHRRARRNLIFSDLELTRNGIVGLFCSCADRDRVQQRIEKRARELKHEDNQADSMTVYDHIVSQFQLPDLDEIPASIDAAIFEIQTSSNEISQVSCRTNGTALRDWIPLLSAAIRKHLDIALKEMNT